MARGLVGQQGGGENCGHFKNIPVQYADHVNKLAHLIPIQILFHQQRQGPIINPSTNWQTAQSVARTPLPRMENENAGGQTSSAGGSPNPNVKQTARRILGVINPHYGVPTLAGAEGGAQPRRAARAVNTPTIVTPVAQVRGNGDNSRITLAHTTPTPTTTPGQTVAIEAAEKSYDDKPATEIDPPAPVAAKRSLKEGPNEERKWTPPSLDPNIITKFAGPSRGEVQVEEFADDVDADDEGARRRQRRAPPQTKRRTSKRPMEKRKAVH